MSDTITVQMGQRGVVTLPKALRESYNQRWGQEKRTRKSPLSCPHAYMANS